MKLVLKRLMVSHITEFYTLKLDMTLPTESFVDAAAMATLSLAASS